MREDFDNRRRDATRLRWTFDEGPRLGLRWFEKVTARERLTDRVSAIFDALSRVHRSADPIVAYDKKLGDEIEVARNSMRVSRAMSNTIDSGKPGLDGFEIDPDDKALAIRVKRADVALAQEQLKNQKIIEEEIGTTYFAALEAALKERMIKDRVIFDKWASKLGRPSYQDRLGDLRAWFKDKAGTTAEQPNAESSSMWDRLKLRFGKIFNIAPVVLVPAEAFFAFPAFQFLTPNDRLAALAGALIFTGLLALLGHAFAMFLVRGFPNHLDDSDITLLTRYRWRPLFSAVVMLSCAILLSFSGADLRSKLPGIAALEKKTEALALKQSQITARALSDKDLAARAEIASAQQQLDIEEEGVDQRRVELLQLKYTLDTSDKIVALCVYFAMFIVSGVRVILSRDPIFEYELATLTIRELEDGLSRIEVAREALRLHWRNSIHQLRDQLARCQAQLGVYDPGDPLAIPASQQSHPCGLENSTKDDVNSAQGSTSAVTKTPASSAGSAKTDSPETDLGKSSNPAVMTFDKFSVAWRRDRVRRYAMWYGAFTWNGLGIYEKSRASALARNPVSISFVN